MSEDREGMEATLKGSGLPFEKLCSLYHWRAWGKWLTWSSFYVTGIALWLCVKRTLWGQEQKQGDQRGGGARVMAAGSGERPDPECIFQHYSIHCHSILDDYFILAPLTLTAHIFPRSLTLSWWPYSLFHCETSINKNRTSKVATPHIPISQGLCP